MSKIPGLKFMVKRQGQDGKIGPFRKWGAGVIPVAEASKTLIKHLVDQGYYEGAKEEFEDYMAELGYERVAGDQDGDGDFDDADREIIKQINDDVREIEEGYAKANAEREAVKGEVKVEDDAAEAPEASPEDAGEAPAPEATEEPSEA